MFIHSQETQNSLCLPGSVWVKREGQKLLETKTLMAPKCAWSDCLNPVLKSFRSVICMALSSSVSSRCKHCSQSPVCNLGTTSKVAWKEDRRTAFYLSSRNDFTSVLLPYSTRGRYGLITACFQNTSPVSAKRWPQDIDQHLVCFVLVAMLFSASHLFFSALLFVPLFSFTAGESSVQVLTSSYIPRQWINHNYTHCFAHSLSDELLCLYECIHRSLEEKEVAFCCYLFLFLYKWSLQTWNLIYQRHLSLASSQKLWL